MRRQAPSPQSRTLGWTDCGLEPLAQLARRAKELRLRVLRTVRTQFAGRYSSAFHGRGMEFGDFVPYAPGDDARHIDWRVTARRPDPYVRRYIEERRLRMILAIDVSRSMAVGAPGTEPRVRALTAAALLALAAAQSGDTVGGFLFGGEVLEAVEPRRGEEHALGLVRRALASQARHRHTDLRPVLRRLRNLRGHALAVILSDFLSEPTPWEPDVQRLLAACARQHHLMAVILQSTPEVDSGAGVIVQAVQAEEGLRLHLDSYGAGLRALRAARREHLRNLEDVLGDCGVRSTAVGEAEPISRALSRICRAR